jgi:hypothetical protein
LRAGIVWWGIRDLRFGIRSGCAPRNGSSGSNPFPHVGEGRPATCKATPPSEARAIARWYCFGLNPSVLGFGGRQVSRRFALRLQASASRSGFSLRLLAPASRFGFSLRLLALALAGRSPRSFTGPLGSGGRRSIRPQGWPHGCGQGFRQARDGLSENPDRLTRTLCAWMRRGRGRGVAFLWPTFLWPLKER